MIERIRTQELVENFKNLLGVPVHVISSKGIVVASSDSNNVGTYHSFGDIIIKNNGHHTCNWCEENKLGGFYLPIEICDEVIGVINVGSEDEKLKSHGLILKSAIEALGFENESLHSKKEHYESIRMFFAQLFLSNFHHDYETLLKRARQLKINYKNKYIVIGRIFEKTESKGYIDCHDSIQTMLKMHLGYSFWFHNNMLVIIANSCDDINNRLEKVSEMICKTYGLSFAFVHSEICETLKDYPIQFELVKNACMFRYIRSMGKLVHSVSDNIELYLIENLSKQHRREYLQFFSNMYSDYKTGRNIDLINTAKSYYVSGMSIQETSESMHTHRNTIAYRMGQFKRLYGFDLKSHRNCMTVYLAILCMETMVDNQIDAEDGGERNVH